MVLGMAGGLIFLQSGEAFYNVSDFFNGVEAGLSMMAFAVALVIVAIIIIPKDG